MVNTHHRPSLSDWLAGILTSAILGLLFLGAGGRAGMRLIAVAQGQAPSFTLEGSLAVIALGGATGAVVGLIFLLARVFFPDRRLLRVSFFWVVTALLVLRGLRPVTATNAAIFLPLFAAHAALLNLYWCRVRVHSVSLRASGRAAAS